MSLFFRPKIWNVFSVVFNFHPKQRTKNIVFIFIPKNSSYWQSNSVDANNMIKLGADEQFIEVRTWQLRFVKYWDGFLSSTNILVFCTKISSSPRDDAQPYTLLLLLTWFSEILTCVSFSCRAAAISIRRARVKYLLKWNSFSSSVSCFVEKLVRPVLLIPPAPCPP